MAELTKKNEQEFREWVNQQLRKHPYQTPSGLVLKSFHIFDVTKPEGVTTRSFDWLRSVAENQKQLFGVKK